MAEGCQGSSEKTKNAAALVSIFYYGVVQVLTLLVLQTDGFFTSSSTRAISKRLCLFGGFWDSKKAPKRHQKGIILLVYCLVFSTLSYFKKVYSFLVFSTLVFLVFLVSSAIVSRVPELRRFLVF